MMRPFSLIILAVALAACARDPGGIATTGGDSFVLDGQGLSGRGAVENGLAQAQSFCGEHGRLFVLTNSQIGSNSYRLEFRCIAMNNVPPPPPVASAPPPPPPRTARGRRGAPAPAPELASSGAPLGFAASLPAMTAPPAPVAWSLGTANVPPPLPPVATTPLFAPPPGVVLAVPPLSGPRLPPADSSALVALPRLDAVATLQRPQAVAAPAMAPLEAMAAGQPVLSREPLPPVGTLPLLQSQAPSPPGQAAAQPVVRAEALPPIQAQPLVAPAPALSNPPTSFGMVVPSPNPLPGASSSLPPIAGGNTRPLALPGGNPTTLSSGGTGFSQGFR
jgi:hypothetical protein